MSDIRLAKPQDAAAIARIYAPLVTSSMVSFEVDAPDELEMRRRIEAVLPRYAWLVCEHAGDIVGYAYAAEHRVRAAYRWSVDVSVYVHESWRGMGVGLGLYTSLFEILRAQGFVQAFAGIALPNPASVGLHEAMGFQGIGVYRRVGYKLGRWHDVGWWQLQLQDPPAAPQAPSTLVPLLQDAPGWQRLLAAGRSCFRIAGDSAAPPGTGST